MVSITPVQNLDFFEVKESLKTYLKNQSRFKDYDLEGSNLNVLLDVLAYNTFYNNFYYNMALSEMFLDSAQVRNSVLSHAKELNYLPRSRRSSVATVNLTLTSTKSTYTLSETTQFLGKCGNQTYTFLPGQKVTATKTGTNTHEIANLKLYEGRLIQEILTTENFVISNSKIDTTSLKVYLNSKTDANEITYRSDIFGVGSTDLVYYLQPEEDEKYSLVFGDNQFGYQPTNTDQIIVEYRVCAGPDADGVTSFTVSLPNTTSATVTLVSFADGSDGRSRGGALSESIESIRKFAPKALQTQERAVTKSDYETLLRRRFSSIQAISVYGGDEVDPPQYGRVIVSVDVQGGEGASDTEIKRFKNYLVDKTPLTIEPVFVPAKFMYISLVVNVVYDPKVTSSSASAIQNTIIDRLVNNATNYNDVNLNDFNATLRQSRLAAYIDASDTSIVSTDIVSKPIIEYIPELSITNSPLFDFAEPLDAPYAFDETIGFSNYDPAITTTNLTLDGTSVSLQDNGLGEIIAVTTTESNRSIFKRNVGTVDYTTGKVRLSNFIVDSFEGNAIQIVANTIRKDVRAPKDRILVLRENDINITVSAL